MLASVSDLETYLGLAAGNSEEAFLTDLLTRASAYVEARCNRTFAAQTYIETRNGNGGTYMALRNAPVTAVSSLTINGIAVPLSVQNTGYVTPGFRADDNGLYLNGYTFLRGGQNISVTYSAGFATVPDEIKAVAIEVAALMYREKDRLGETSRTLGGSTTSFDTRGLSDRSNSVIQNYKMVVPL